MARLNINLIQIDYFFVAYKNIQFTAGTEDSLLFSFLISSRYKIIYFKITQTTIMSYQYLKNTLNILIRLLYE